jgi:hypothetical protein
MMQLEESMGSKISAVRIAEAQLFHAESISKNRTGVFSFHGANR